MSGANEFEVAGSVVAENAPKDEPTVLVRKLSGEVSTYLEQKLSPDGEHRFIVVERVARDDMTDEDVRDCVREARLVLSLEHPNVVPVRDIAVKRDEIRVASDYVSGERLSELWGPPTETAPALPLEIALRILVDVATGLGALHKLRNEEGHERVKFVHAEVTATNVVVGLDGVSQLLRAARVRRRNILPSVGLETLAPEVLTNCVADQRADVYSMGALLWQALSGRPLFQGDSEAIVANAQRGAIERAVVTGGASWALPLADVAARALAPAPEKRFPTASSMVTEVRRIAGSKMASAVAVAQFVESRAGEKIAARLSDVQASAVIRKAISIPAPPASSPDSSAAVTLPRARRESKPTLAAAAPPRVTAPPVALPDIDEHAKTIAQASSPVVAAAPPVVASTPPIAKVAPPVAPTPRIAKSAPRVVAPAPPAVVPAPPIAKSGPPVIDARVKSTLPASRPEPARPPPPAAPKKPALAPKRAPASAPVRRASAPLRVASASTLAASSSRRRDVGLMIGALASVIVVTGFLAMRAVRNRQDISTPGSMPLAALPEPAPESIAPREPIKESPAIRGATRPISVKPASSVSSMPSAQLAKPSSAPKPPTAAPAPAPAPAAKSQRK